jgi:spermidine synthase
MVSATLLIGADPHFRRPVLTLLPLILAITLPLVSPAILGGRLPDVLLRKMISSAQDELLEAREGLVGTTSITRSPEHGFVLYDNGVVIGGEQRGNFRTGGFIPVLMQREPPKRVLSLAFGAGVSSYASRSLPSLQQLTCVDISRENINAALEYFPENAGLRQDRRAGFVVDDAYNFVKYSEDSYDLILLEPTPPMFSFRCASLYTREFYAHAAKRLTSNGLFTQVIPLANLSSAEARSVMKTFAAVFSECFLWFNGWDSVMIGSNQRILLDAGEIVRRLGVPRIQEALARSSPHKYHLPANFIAGLLLTSEEFRRVAADGVIYTDDRSDLRYSTGEEDSHALIEQIHANLSPWNRIHDEVFVFQQLGNELPKLVGLREMLMLGLYRGDARCRKMLRYIEGFSSRKAVDYQSLIAELGDLKQLSSVQKKTLNDAMARLAQLRADQSTEQH